MVNYWLINRYWWLMSGSWRVSSCLLWLAMVEMLNELICMVTSGGWSSFGWWLILDDFCAGFPEADRCRWWFLARTTFRTWGSIFFAAVWELSIIKATKVELVSGSISIGIDLNKTNHHGVMKYHWTHVNLPIRTVPAHHFTKSSHWSRVNHVMARYSSRWMIWNNA